MDNKTFIDGDSLSVIPSICFAEGEEKPYVDIKFIDVMDADRHEEFIIQKSVALENENIFYHYCRNKQIISDENEFENFVQDVQQFFPEIHFKDYKVNEVAKALVNIYVTLTTKGPREILYKAGLDNIAFNFDKVYQFYKSEKEATTPGSIVSGERELPIRLLRILNQDKLVDRLYDKMGIWIAEYTYMHFSCYIHKKDHYPNRIQWLYLEELSHGIIRGDESIKFNPKIYEQLNYTEEYIYIALYMDFEKYNRELLIHCLPMMKVPCMKDLFEVLRSQKQRLSYITNKKYHAKEFNSRIDWNDYEYFGNDLCVISPKNFDDYLQEARNQSSCLLEQIENVVLGDSIILFVRKKSCMDLSYITIELRDGCLVQAYGKFNSKLTVKDLLFLEEYCVARSINCNMDQLTSNYFDEDDESQYNEMIREYCKDYNWRQVFTFDDAISNVSESYHQLSVFDLYEDGLDEFQE